MIITLTAGTGSGPTALAAFDTALLEAGVGNYNLLPLSSVIPASSVLEHKKHISPGDDYGHRLYVVMAEQEVTELGQEAWAGLGWVQDESGKGLFVEHHGHSEAYVRDSITASLQTMTARRDDYHGCPIHQKVVGIHCSDEPVAALVVAVYQSEGWA